MLILVTGLRTSSSSWPDLASRVASLEQRATPEPLARRNAEERARGERRRAAIKQLLESHPGPERGAAKRIYPYLPETGICLSVRAVQHHITQLRKAGALRL